jgi:hypothetical protein
VVVWQRQCGSGNVVVCVVQSSPKLRSTHTHGSAMQCRSVQISADQCRSV